MPPRRRISIGHAAAPEEMTRTLSEWRRIAQLGLAKASPTVGGPSAAAAATTQSKASGSSGVPALPPRSM